MGENSTSSRRYQRQMILPQIGEKGQQRLAEARVLLVGCGALGTVFSEQLARAGVGFLRIVDRDVVEWSNLQRQTLFEEDDARNSTPKAVAAGERLRRINSDVHIDPVVADVHAENIERIIQAGTDLLIDGTDNAETRYLINDVCVKRGIPWIYGACVGTEGRVMSVRPGRGPCLRCIFQEPPAVGEVATCDVAGVLGAAAGVVGSVQAAEAIRILVGGESSTMLSFDLWEQRWKPLSTDGARREHCVCCAQRRFEFLEGGRADAVAALCGRDAVQVRGKGAVDLSALEARWKGVGKVARTPYLVRCELHEPAGIRLTVFPDGRAIVHGTTEVDRARSTVAKYLGN